MKNKLDSYHLPVTGRNILQFAFPTIVMTVFNTFYTMVDGLFVSNLIGMEALSAINLTAPAICKLFRITEPAAKGVGIGSAAHAIGTARALEIGPVEGAMSSLSIAVAGILTALFCPLAVNLLP